jgi:hypothetical protein
MGQKAGLLYANKVKKINCKERKKINNYIERLSVQMN